MAAIRAVDVTPRQFIEGHVLPNAPALLSARCTGTDTWGARRALAPPGREGDAEQCVNLERLLALLSMCVAGESARVPVEVVDDDGAAGYGERRREEMPLPDYVAWWRRRRHGEAAGPLRYLKDLHPCRERGAAAADALYRVPPHFADDWLNAWATARTRDDYRFLYAGPAGTWTAVHHDVLNSFSWSANVFGHKLWLLWPPGVEESLAVAPGSAQLVPDAREAAAAQYSPEVQARLARARAQALTIAQGPGEVVFVPAGWHHQVHNVTDCVSINHNWTNGFGLAFAWPFLREASARVSAELDHLHPARGGELAFGSAREFFAHCQLVLRADAGMALADFVAMLREGIGRAHAIVAAADGADEAERWLGTVDRHVRAAASELRALLLGSAQPTAASRQARGAPAPEAEAARPRERLLLAGSCGEHDHHVQPVGNLDSTACSRCAAAHGAAAACAEHHAHADELQGRRAEDCAITTLAQPVAAGFVNEAEGTWAAVGLTLLLRSHPLTTTTLRQIEDLLAELVSSSLV